MYPEGNQCIYEGEWIFAWATIPNLLLSNILSQFTLLSNANKKILIKLKQVLIAGTESLFGRKFNDIPKFHVQRQASNNKKAGKYNSQRSKMERIH